VRLFSTFQIGMGWFPELPGGLDRVYYYLAAHLRRQGVGVYGAVVGSPEVARSTEGDVIPFARLDDSLTTRLRKARSAIGQALEARRPDIIASHFALFTAPVLDKLRHAPLVVHFHGPWAEELTAETGSDSFRGRLKHTVGHLIERLVYRRASRCIVLSRAFGDILVRNYHVPEELIRIVPGGVDLARFLIPQSKAEARREFGLEPDRPIVVAVRRLARRMGLDHLIDAIARVRLRYPDVLLLIGGRGPLAAELKSRIEVKGLEKNVRLLGFVPDDKLALLYRAADFSVVPTVALEGFGLITLESLAAGTPVLVTPVGGLPDAVSALSTDLVFVSAAPADIAQGIIDALCGRRSLPGRDECQAYISENFTWTKMAHRTISVYSEALH
jgi:glycosyltransferase involved in cell wall biosynthesis